MAAVNVDIAPVLWAGRELVVDHAVFLPDFASYAFVEPAQVRLAIRRLDRGVDIVGTVDATYVGMCDRCLGDVQRAMHVDVEEHLVPDAGRREGDPFSEGNVLEGTMLDVSDLARQLIDSALPLTILCSEDCAGLCSLCGRRREACRCPENSSLSLQTTETTWPI